jgi:hypothetical protein
MKAWFCSPYLQPITPTYTNKTPKLENLTQKLKMDVDGVEDGAGHRCDEDYFWLIDSRLAGMAGW